MAVLFTLYFCLFLLSCVNVMVSEIEFLPKVDTDAELQAAVRPLQNLCVERKIGHGLVQLVCFQRSVMLVNYDPTTYLSSSATTLGWFVASESKPDEQVFIGNSTECAERRIVVSLECCSASDTEEAGGDVDSNGGSSGGSSSSSGSSGSKGGHPTHQNHPHNSNYYGRIVGLPGDGLVVPVDSHTASIRAVDESLCKMRMVVCSSLVCAAPVARPSAPKVSRSSSTTMSLSQQAALRSKTRDMFIHAYDAYVAHAYPQGELRPIACEGGPFELIKIPAVTLVDALDTLVVMGNYTEFRHAVSMILRVLPNFQLDVNVSVFETTIRILGGLLSGHLAAVHPHQQLFAEDEYQDELLHLARDLGNRLLPAFATKTGIPYGTVNLLHGVPRGETKIASTAGAGSLILEFQTLSLLTNDSRYGAAAWKAMQALHSRRSQMGLLGKHINTETGQWLETTSGVGSNSDSYYEYLLKASALPATSALSPLEMFTAAYHPIQQHVLTEGRWFNDVDMFTGKHQRRRMEALDAFWPGLEASLGEVQQAARQLNAFYAIARELVFLPEEVDYSAFLSQPVSDTVQGTLQYPLRPELVEATYLHYRATGDRTWLSAAARLLQSLDNVTRTGCGYASVQNLRFLELEDSMPSYFLAETLKYLYLLFEEDHPAHAASVVYTTEAHPLDVLQLHGLARRQAPSPAPADVSSPRERGGRCRRLAYPHLPESYAADAAAASTASAPRATRHLRSVARMARWLAAPTAQAAPFPSAPETSPKCGLDEMNGGRGEARGTRPAAPPPRGSLPGPPLKQVEVGLGPLGDFAVSVYADGFSVTAAADGASLDMFITDRKENVIAREGSPGAGLEAVVAHHAGFGTRCAVALRGASPPAPRAAHFRRSCSVATFGATHALTVTAPLHVAGRDRGTFCSPATGAVEAPPAPPPPVASRQARKRDRDPWWWAGASRLDHILTQLHSRTFFQTSPPSPEPVPPEDVRDKLVVVTRGDCLFEEKTRHAQDAGARGVIVHNNEETVFVMAGAQDVDPSSVPGGPITIPTVMLAQSDGRELAAVASTLSDAVAEVSIHISADVLQSRDLFGSQAYPKVFLARHVVYVLTSGMWGAYFKSQRGDDWQMYLMSKADLSTHRLLPPTSVLSPSRRKMTTSAHLLLSGPRMYSWMLRRQCPPVRVVDGGRRVQLPHPQRVSPRSRPPPWWAVER